MLVWPVSPTMGAGSSRCSSGIGSGDVPRVVVLVPRAIRDSRWSSGMCCCKLPDRKFGLLGYRKA